MRILWRFSERFRVVARRGTKLFFGASVLAAAQGAYFLAQYRLSHGDAPHPASPCGGIVVVTSEDGDDEDGGSNIDRRNAGALVSRFTQLHKLRLDRILGSYSPRWGDLVSRLRAPFLTRRNESNDNTEQTNWLKRSGSGNQCTSIARGKEDGITAHENPLRLPLQGNLFHRLSKNQLHQACKQLLLEYFP